jgi:phosphoribosylanthranilate isomerase
LRAAPHVDALLLDSGSSSASAGVKQLGGTGRTHDWALSAEIRAAASVPLFLAGGLSPENVRAAIDQVEPWGVDVCSGLRTEGRLDRGKLLSFLRACGHPVTPPAEAPGI